MGERFGKYHLERKLAVGGMAEIFLATHQGPEGFKKHVAIKRILPHLTEDSDFVTMFLDEARLVARFNHPNIVQIFELGEVDSRYFLAMEFVNGVSMSKLLKACRKTGNQLPLEYGAKIISYACEGLDYAHSFTDADGTPLNLIHRDISPQNLMLSYDGVLKVLDFGIAKATGNVYQTRTSSLKGKAAYMSPEQITQKTGLDRRSDIFSLGIVLFEFVTGRRPYSGDTELELMMAIVQKEAPDPRQFNELIPDELAAIIGRALTKDREQRYQSCRELRQELEEFLINRRMLVDNYALGALARELIPPSETGVGYAVPTPSRPSLVATLGSSTSNPPPAARTPTGQRKPPPVVVGGDDAPTQMTPSSQLRPLFEGLDATADSARPQPAAEPPPPVSTGSRSATHLRRPESGSGRRIGLALVVLMLVGATGAGGAFLIFGGEQPPTGPDAGQASSAVQRPASPDPAGQPGAVPDTAPAEPSQPAAPSGPVETDPAQGPEAPDPGAGRDEAKTPPPTPAHDRTPRHRRRTTHRRRTRAAHQQKKPEPAKPEPKKPEPAAQPAPPKVARAEPAGKLVVDTRPWTNVAIDGTAYGTTPVGPVDLRPGLHQVVLANKAKGIRLTRAIRILPGQTQRVQEKFGQGLVQVFVKPFGEVFVNGISKGLTPLGGPIKLFEGKHTVKVVCSRTGKQDSQRIQVKAGETRKLIFDLR